MMNWLHMLVEVVKPLFFAAITLFFGLLVIKTVTKITTKQLEKAKLDESIKPFLQSVIHVSLKILLVVSVVGILGVPIASFVALLGTAGLAIGLAFQGSLSNLAGGLLLLTVRPFKVGDYIECTGFSGTVKAISILYTELVTPDHKVIFMPNAQLSNAGITNYSTNDTRRVDFSFSVSYDADDAHVVSVLQSVISKDARIHTEPAPFVALSCHSPSSMDYVVRVWVSQQDYWDVYYDILKAVTQAFSREKIVIPYPTIEINNVKV